MHCAIIKIHSNKEEKVINLDFLEYLVEFAKTENLTHASRVLNVSQSALTRAMQKIEDYIGVPIFEHSKNKLSLNATGKELVKNAQNVINAEKEMVTRTVDFYNRSTSLSIGTVAPGPMIKYGNLLFSLFPNKTITSKIETTTELTEKLLNNTFDIIFVNTPIENDEVISKFAFTEKLYITIPKSHFLAGMTNGVQFSEIDGQSFLVAENLGIWDDIINKNLPKSKFFPQLMENLSEIINASTIPNFSTNLTNHMRVGSERVSIPILNNEASINFYIAYKKQNKAKIKEFLKYI